MACSTRIAQVVSHRTLWPIVAGGLFYSVGAVLNLIRRPILWPATFGTHDLFHLFVIAGSLLHYWFVLRVVVPFTPDLALAEGDSDEAELRELKSVPRD